MKRLLVLLVFCLILAAPVMGTALTYQNGVSYTNMSYGTTTATYVNNITAGNSYIFMPDHHAQARILSNAYPTTYAAATVRSSSYNWGGPTIYLYSATGAWMATYACDLMNPANVPCNTEGARYEVKIVGTTAYFYVDGMLKQTTTGLTQNPAYIGLTHLGDSGGWDDVVYGDDEIKYIVGMPASNGYYIKKDFVNPANSGVFNYTTGALVNSNYMYTTWGRSNVSAVGGNDINESMYLQNVDSGTTYETHYTGNATAGTTTWDISTSLVAANAPYGLYRVRFGTFDSDTIAYIADGAEITFDKSNYNQNDVATMTYNIEAAYWDTSTYTYAIKVYRANDWVVVHTQGLTARTGTDTYQFTSADTQGTYYAVITATPNAGGSDIWLVFDYAQMTGYFAPYGYVNNETGQMVVGANVSMSQDSLVSNTITTASGNYTTTGFLTGSTLIINVTAAGHSQYYATMVPMVTGSKYINITLNSTSPSFTGLGIGGIHRDGILTGTLITSGYGRPISGATAHAKNTTYGDYCTNVSNNVGCYKVDESNGCILTTGRLYDVWSEKPGYSNSPNYTVVA